jgi:peptidoglycan/LPS O-acetylase OafA/YrhL
MRIEFFSRLALLVVAAIMVVATQVWATDTLQWVFIAGGLVMLVLAAAPGGAGTRRQRMLSAVVAVVGIWAIVQAAIFQGDTMMWVSFGTAVAGGLLAIAGLIDHEMSTERVVHELQVTTPVTARSGASFAA